MNKEYSKPATTVIEIAGIVHLAEGTQTPLGDGEVNPDGTFDAGSGTDAPGYPYQCEEARAGDAEPHPYLTQRAADFRLWYLFAVARHKIIAYYADG